MKLFEALESGEFALLPIGKTASADAPLAKRGFNAGQYIGIAKSGECVHVDGSGAKFSKGEAENMFVRHILSDEWISTTRHDCKVLSLGLAIAYSEIDFEREAARIAELKKQYESLKQKAI
jgi:hypothetical protein